MGDLGSFSGLGRSLGEGIAISSSIPAWRIPWHDWTTKHRHSLQLVRSGFLRGLLLSLLLCPYWYHLLLINSWGRHRMKLYTCFWNSKRAVIILMCLFFRLNHPERKKSEVTQSCLTQWDSPGKSTEVGCFNRGSSCPRDRTQVSHIVGRCFTIWATGKATITWVLFKLLHGLFFLPIFKLSTEKRYNSVTNPVSCRY